MLGNTKKNLYFCFASLIYKFWFVILLYFDFLMQLQQTFVFDYHSFLTNLNSLILNVEMVSLKLHLSVIKLKTFAV